MPQYVDTFGFVPLPLYLDKMLEEIASSADSKGDFSTDGYPPEIQEMKELGYVSEFFQYMNHVTNGTLSAKGLHYFDEKRAWEGRVFEWQQRLDNEEKNALKHDWKLNIVNGAYALVGAALGALVAFLT